MPTTAELEARLVSDKENIPEYIKEITSIVQEATNANQITEKTSPVSNDIFVIQDSEDSNAFKHVKMSNIAHTDADAIHDDTAAEISAITGKGTPVGADMILIEDSADSDNKKKMTITNLLALGATDSTAVHDNVAAEISAVAAKGTPIGADFVLIEDTEASDAKKRITLTNLLSIGATDSAAIHDDTAAEISAVAEKATPISADFVLLEDSADSDNKKRCTIETLAKGFVDITLTGQGASAQDTETQAASGTHTIDWANGNSTVWDLQAATGNLTLTLSNPVSGASYVIKIIQSSVARTVTWPGAVLWPGGAAPTISVADDAIDVISLYYDGANYLGNFAQDFS